MALSLHQYRAWVPNGLMTRLGCTVCMTVGAPMREVTGYWAREVTFLIIYSPRSAGGQYVRWQNTLEQKCDSVDS